MSLLDLRIKAANEGKVKFWSGIPCKKGHLSERYVSTGGCLQCLRPALAEHALKGKIAEGMLYQPPAIMLDTPLPQDKADELSRLIDGWVRHTLTKWSTETLT